MKQNNIPQQTHFIGVLLPEDITLTLEDCRRYMRESYGCKSGHRTPIHVTLVPPFRLQEEYSTEDLPNVTRDFNRFMEWRTNKPEITITEYYGHPELDEYTHIDFNNNEPLEAEIKKAIKYTKKFIPVYLDWYISKITAWCR